MSRFITIALGFASTDLAARYAVSVYLTLSDRDGSRSAFVRYLLWKNRDVARRMIHVLNSQKRIYTALAVHQDCNDFYAL
jgi:hypothetical protein